VGGPEPAAGGAASAGGAAGGASVAAGGVVLVPVPAPALGPEGAAGGGVGGAPPLEFGPGSPYEGETGAIAGGGEAEAAVDVGDAALELVCVGARSVGSFSVWVRPGRESGAGGADAVVLGPAGSSGLVGGVVVVFVRAALTVGLSGALVSGLTGAAVGFADLVGRAAGCVGLSAAGLTCASM
jgi:hypothetical protein